MARAIMIQGTSSGVGKSILTTALCRIFAQDGYSVAPFKSQNMSANAHRLPNGDRMARSQAIAAYACQLEPMVQMNPILLNPTQLHRTEVVVCGKSWGYIDALDYNEYKKKAFAQAIDSYHQLAAHHDIIVIEGAGSPVELNLNKNDLANMGLAERLGCPVLLVSDILRGGVFASLYGTMELLTPAQRSLVKGMVVNKFKGLVQHFLDGKEILEQLCGVPVVGIVPHLEINLEDEDSLVEAGQEMKTQATLAGKLDEAGYRAQMEQEFDRLAHQLRQCMAIEQIYGFMEEVRHG